MNARSTPAKPPFLAGQYSAKGLREENQDALALRLPEDDSLRTKGAVAALADGLSSAGAAREAAESCVLGFISDYYATPALWSVARSAQRVLDALNRWLYRQTLAGESHLCTLSLLVLRGHTAHLFQVGDSRIWRLRHGQLQCLTRDHSRQLGNQQRVLTRAMGADSRLEVDYSRHTIEVGDSYLLTSDGIHDSLSPARMQGILRASSHPDQASQQLAEAALAAGSDDNVSCQLVCVQQLPEARAEDAIQRGSELPLPPPLSAGMVVDGFTVERELYASSRSQLYLVRDAEGLRSALKTPSVNLVDDRDALERFALEGWIAGRLRNAHLLRPLPLPAQPSCLYQRLEYVDGVTLQQWLQGHPDASVEEKLYLADQLLNGVRALHRADVIHADLKPDNVMIDRHGLVRIIDFGSCHCRGLDRDNASHALGTREYSAPELANGEPPSEQSDLFSVALIIHEMLTGSLPWQGHYQRAERQPLPPLQGRNAFIPPWVTQVLAQALSHNPQQRFQDAAEFRQALKKPVYQPGSKPTTPLPSRQLWLWKGISAILLVLLLISWGVQGQL